MPLASKECRPRRNVNLRGPDGNAYAVMGMVGSIIRQFAEAGILPKGEEKDYIKRATSGDYQNLLAVSREYVDIVDTSEPDEEEENED